jgi:hypothetical protein
MPVLPNFPLTSKVLALLLGCAAAGCGGSRADDPSRGAAGGTGGSAGASGGSGGTLTSGAGGSVVGGAGGSTAGGAGGVSSGGSAGSSSGAGGTIANGGTGLAGGIELFTDPIPSARMHRLTESELAHSLQDLLGADVPIGELEPDVPVDGYASIGATTVSVSPAGVGLHERAVLAATAHVVADVARTQAQLPCVPASAADTACLDQIVTKLGRRAFRRPLTDLEVQRFTGLATTIGSAEGSSVLVGVRHALSAILQSPSFLYRVELGAASAEDGGRLKYTSFEMASRLAATFWDSVPDDALLDAADQGALATPDGVRAEAERLLADPRSERSIAVFTQEWFGFSRLAEAVKDTGLFGTWNDSLKDAMREELERRVVDMVFVQKGDFLSLFDDRKTFVNDELARFYGLPESGQAGFHPAEFPAEARRAGLLGAGAFLAGHAMPQRTAPTSRGKFVAEQLLCRIIPPIPDNVPPLPAMAGPEVTLRDRLTAHREDPTCRGCHGLMDPMGFGMEDFDSVGIYRTMDGDNPVDATGVLDGDGLDGSAFNGLAELGAALRRQPVLAPCIASKLYADALGRRAVELDRAALGELTASFAGAQFRLDQLLIALVTSDSFRFAEPRG